MKEQKLLLSSGLLCGCMKRGGDRFTGFLLECPDYCTWSLLAGQDRRHHQKMDGQDGWGNGRGRGMVVGEKAVMLHWGNITKNNPATVNFTWL
jgi:hypothetical protein